MFDQRISTHQTLPSPHRVDQARERLNYNSGIALERAMFDWQSRHLILMLTLSYRPEWRHVMTLDDIRRDRDHLLRNIRSNGLLRGINGYIWAIEEGEESGLHMHWLFFYDREHRADILIGDAIGQYWANVITRGRGDFWNSSHDKIVNARKWGDITGQVNYGDVEKREALRRVIGYLAKSDQHVASRNNPHIRMFGTSHPPS